MDSPKYNTSLFLFIFSIPILYLLTIKTIKKETSDASTQTPSNYNIPEQNVQDIVHDEEPVKILDIKNQQENQQENHEEELKKQDDSGILESQDIQNNHDKENIDDLKISKVNMSNEEVLEAETKIPESTTTSNRIIDYFAYIVNGK